MQVALAILFNYPSLRNNRVARAGVVEAIPSFGVWTDEAGDCLVAASRRHGAPRNDAGKLQVYHLFKHLLPCLIIDPVLRLVVALYDNF